MAASGLFKAGCLASSVLNGKHRPGGLDAQATYVTYHGNV